MLHLTELIPEQLMYLFLPQGDTWFYFVIRDSELGDTLPVSKKRIEFTPRPSLHHTPD